MLEGTIFSDTFLAMGSHCDVVLPNVDADFAKKVFQNIKKEVEQLENGISRHSVVSSIWEVNNAAKNEWIELSGELWEILTICKDFYQISSSAFDVTIAPLQAIWIDKDPDEKGVKNTKKKCGFDKVELDLDNQRIRFEEDNMEFDFGVIEKAFALDMIKPMLLDMGVKDAIVSFEEDHILAMGNHPAGDKWPLGIRNLQKPSEFLHVFPTSDQTVNTTGTIFVKDDGLGIKNRIVISPETGRPVEGKKAVSVKADSATMGAFIAHIWLLLPDGDKEILSNQFQNIEILEIEYLEGDVKTKLDIIDNK